MGIKAILSKPIARFFIGKVKRWSAKPVETQNKVFKRLITSAQNTQFGKDHHFDKIKDYESFKQNVPIRDYEGHRPYVDKILEGKDDVLWPGKPLYFSKTSGTTSGVKYIPITKASMPAHINAARDALLTYIDETGKSEFFDGSLIFLSGSPEMEKKAGIYYGRLSGIVNHHIPSVLQANQLPTYDTNCIEDWEEKLDKIIDETLDKRMMLISGIPPWVQMYFDKIVARTGKKIKDVFPEFNLFVYGGVNFEPYRKKLYETIGKEVDSIELYPASEGFIAYQNAQDDKGLLLLLNSGIFYEFIPVGEYGNDNPTRLSIGEVELGVNYAIILSTNAGLWGYSIGDTVKFTSKTPYKIIVTGRLKHFISAFGEHVIAEEVEKAFKETCKKFKEVEAIEFTVAPSVSPEEGSSRHEWYIEFATPPNDLENFEATLDLSLTQLNTYYDDLIKGSILQKLVVKPLLKDSFVNYMKSIGKLGGQNKVPRLSNDRKIANTLEEYTK